MTYVGRAISYRSKRRIDLSVPSHQEHDRFVIGEVLTLCLRSAIGEFKVLKFCVAEGIPALYPGTISHCSFCERCVMVECTSSTEGNFQEADAS